MKTLITLFASVIFNAFVFCQTDTISHNIFQNNGNLGIGIDIPTHSLQINNELNTGIERNLLSINNLSIDTSAFTGIILKTGDSIFQSVIQDYGINYKNTPYHDFGGFLNLSNNSKGLMLHANSLNGIIKFYTGHDEMTGAGIERLRIDSVGNIGIGLKDPKVKLDINGGLKLGNSIETYEGVLRWTGSDFEGYNGTTWLSLTDVSNNLWQQINNKIYYNQGNVGIGTSSPNNYLTIEGNESGWPGRIFFSIKNTSEGSNSLAYMAAEAGTSGNHSVFGHISETYTANDSFEELQDYGWVSSNGNGLIICASKNNRKPGIIKFLSGQTFGTTFDERMRIDTTGYVGIGTSQPKVKLDINGGIRIGYSETDFPGIIRFTGNDFEGYNGTTWLSLTEISNDPWLQINNEIYYNQGNVGIGTEHPYAKLEITDGDIFISDIEKGIIMKSPDGVCWRGTLDNSGILKFVIIQCPDDTIVPGKSKEVVLSQSVLIYPNPTKDKLNIEVKNNYEKVEYLVYNTSGKLVQNGYIRNYFKTVDISTLEKGVYIFEFRDLENNKIAVQKMIKD
jgi:hypothetical protein